jgi:hypothetical protein
MNQLTFIWLTILWYVDLNTLSRPAQRPTQPHIQRILEFLCQG